MADQTTTTTARERVSIDAEAWRLIDALLAELPYRIAAPIVAKIQQTGGVQPVQPVKE